MLGVVDFQGMGMIVATYLLLMEEEDAFWMMVATVEDLLPSSYYSPSLIGVQADQVDCVCYWIEKFLFKNVFRLSFKTKKDTFGYVDNWIW